MSTGDPRDVCWRCQRPTALCVCALFTGRAPVANRTEIVILQHPRERCHAVGTARIARLGLQRVRYVVAQQGWGGLTRELALPAGSGLLYPHPAARPLEALPPGARPPALVVLDGTWATARKLYLANPWLAELPHYQLSPTTPSEYRIREQPRAICLSTIEAIVAALQALEPQTAGLDQLLEVFREMIDAQLRAHAAGPRRRIRRRFRRPRPLPPALLEDSARLLIAYGESTPRRAGGRYLVQWVALRPSSGECFEGLVWPRAGERPDPAHLAHMRLGRAELERGIEPAALQQAWRAFAGERPLLAVWNQSTHDLHRAHLALDAEPVLLKAAYCNLRHAPCGALEQVIAAEGLPVIPAPVSGRAALRLGQAHAVLQLLRRRAADR